jgi:hypothetical protein
MRKRRRGRKREEKGERERERERERGGMCRRGACVYVCVCAKRCSETTRQGEEGCFSGQGRPSLLLLLLSFSSPSPLFPHHLSLSSPLLSSPLLSSQAFNFEQLSRKGALQLASLASPACSLSPSPPYHHHTLPWSS